MAAVYWPSTSIYPSATNYPGQAIDPFHLFWVSFDDIADTPTWTDLSSRMRDDWRTDGGRSSELDEVDATTAAYTLDSRDRALDPTNGASPYAPNLVPNRRVWHRIQTGGKTYNVFRGYVDRWGPTWDESGVGDHVAKVTCTNGRKILTNWALPSADPDVQEYPDVIGSDDPQFYYRLGERAGNKARHHVKKERKRREGESKRHYKAHGYRRWTTRFTRREAEGVPGPAGTYKNTPQLAQQGAIRGDPDTAVRFRKSQSEYMRVDVDQSDLIDTNELTIEAWINPDSIGTTMPIVTGPSFGTGGEDVFSLFVTDTGKLRLLCSFTDGTASGISSITEIAAGRWQHVAGTWDGSTLAVYIDGDLDKQKVVLGSQRGEDSDKKLRQGNASGFLFIARDSTRYFNGLIDEVAVYAKALGNSYTVLISEGTWGTPTVQTFGEDRMLAHYNAAFLGIDAATAARRIEDVLDLVGEWPEWNIQEGASKRLGPVRTAGIFPSTLVDEAVDAEGIPSRFFFSKAGVPTFLPGDHRGFAGRTSARFTFGPGGSGGGGTTALPMVPPFLIPGASVASSGDVEFETASIDDQDAFLYNDVRGTTEGDTTYSAEDAASIVRFGRITLSLDGLPHLSAAETQAYVDNLLGRYKDPMNRIRNFRLNSIESTGSAKDALLSLEQGDTVRVKVQPPGGGSLIDQTSYVERYTLSQAGKGEPIIGEFEISPR